MSASEATEPCWTMDCDACGDALGAEELSHLHAPNLVELEQSARDQEWVHDAEMWFCPECASRRSCTNLGHVPDIKDRTYCTRCDDTIEADR